MNTFHGFGKDFVKYYLTLEEHNNREWFHANRAMYDTNVAFPLKALAGELETDYSPVKVFRPYRNVRFWPDLPPLNEHASLIANTVGNAAYYVRIDADGLLLGCGTWQPTKNQLTTFRQLADSDSGAKEIRKVLAKVKKAGFELTTENALKSAPRGFDKDHPHIDLLRLKSLALSQHWAPEPWLYSRECLMHITTAWKAASPWVDWLRANLPE